jgi:uncharacterized protein (DUF2141 family)
LDTPLRAGISALATAARLAAMLAGLVLPAAALAIPKDGEPGYLPSSPDLGTAEGRCRAEERGPAVLVNVAGLKDRQGTIRAELYPANDADFLHDDNLLIMEGKTFRRVEERIPPSGPVMVCIRLPGPGAYTMSVLHDRDGNRKFGLSSDGIGFPGNPKLGWSKPSAADAGFVAGPRITNITVRLNYRHGLFSFGPLKP